VTSRFSFDAHLPLPRQELAPLREAVADSEGEQSVDVTLEVPWDRPAARFSQVDGRHGKNEPEQVVALISAQVNLK
jgi:hypothetical protein